MAEEPDAVLRLAGRTMQAPRPELVAELAAGIDEGRLSKDRRAFHKLAELGWQEQRTSQAIVHRLSELGYALSLTREVDTGNAVDPSARYHYAFDRGPQRYAAEPGARWPVVRGAALLALAQETYPDAETAVEAKRLMRMVLDHYLEARRIFSRRVVQDLQAIYNNLTAQLVAKPQLTEITSLFAGASILVLLIGGILSLLWFSRLP